MSWRRRGVVVESSRRRRGETAASSRRHRGVSAASSRRQRDRAAQVTGASGFIGSHVVDALLGKGYAVRAVVRDPSNAAKTAHLSALAAACGGEVAFARGDLLEEGSFDDAFAGAAAVVHCAAVVEILNVKDPVKDIAGPRVTPSARVEHRLTGRRRSTPRSRAARTCWPPSRSTRRR